MRLLIIIFSLFLNISILSQNESRIKECVYNKFKKSTSLSVDLTDIDKIDSLYNKLEYCIKHYATSFIIKEELILEIDTTLSIFDNNLLLLIDSNSSKFEEGAFKNTTIYPINNTKLFLDSFQDYSLNKSDVLIVYKPLHLDTDEIFNECMNFWYSTGKVPNFILTDDKSITTINIVVNKLNSTPRISGTVVDKDNKSISNVTWKEFPYLKTSGFFSYPTPLSPRLVMSPKKAGYIFHPEMMFYTENTKHIVKSYKAVKHKLKDGLIIDIDFNDKIINQCLPKEKITQNDIEFSNNKNQGSIGRFNGKSSYINCGNKFHFSDEFTISLWFKSDSINSLPMGLISKGKEFSFKIQANSWAFVSANGSDIKNVNYTFESQKWYNLTIVFHEREYINFFVNGKLIKTFDDNGRYRRTSNSIIIGDNIWNESFKGELDDVRIWNRELNKDEIIKSMNSKRIISVKSEPFNFTYLLLSIFSIILIFIIVKITFKKSDKITINDPHIKLLNNENKKGSRIELFGDLFISNIEGEEITQKFSPQSKNLFILILTHSIKENEGITTQILTDILWPGYAVENSKNARGTAINKLRHSLKHCENINIKFKEKRWILEFDSQDTFCDLVVYNNLIDKLNLCKNSSDIYKISKLIVKVIKTGAIVPSIESEWFDSFKDELTCDVLDICQSKIELLTTKNDALIITRLTDIMFKFDPLNEYALDYKIKALVQSGLHTNANLVYSKFCKLYSELYSEDYNINFNSIINKNPDKNSS